MIYKSAQIEKYLKKPEPQIKAFVVYGANDGLVNEYVKKLIATVSKDLYDPFAVAYFNGSDVNADIGSLVAEYSSQSLMGGRRVVIVKDADNNLTKHLKTMFDDSKSDTLVILASTALNKKSSLVSLGEDREDMGLIACYEDRDEDIFATARSLFVENNFTINNEALQLLCSRLSNDRKTNLGELEKLITYMGDKKTISTDDIQNCISDQSNSNTDDINFFAAGGQTEKAIKSFRKMINEGTEVISIIRSMSYHFTKILTVKGVMEKGETLDKAMFKLQPRVIFFRENSFKHQVAIWPKDRLFSVLELLYKCEKDCKTTNMPVDDIASYCVLQISSAAKKLANVG